VTWSTSTRSKILVLDTDPSSRFLINSLLTVEGYDVGEVSSAATILEQVVEDNPDLVLLDLFMPGADGFELCRRLKQNEQTRLVPVVLLTSCQDQRSRLRGIEAGSDEFLIKPFDPLELLARIKSLVYQKRLNEDLDHAEQALFSIAKAIESRDPNTGDHCERLMMQGKAFGEFLRLPPAAIRNLMWSGYLHDIGKVGLPDAVLLKPGALTLAEQETMRQHVLIGEQICRPLRTMQGLLPIIRHHHERWDGSGYPDGLAGDQIPYLVQVFQILDIYDALTSERPYKRAFTSDKALEILVEETAKGWRNPMLVEQFIKYIRLTQRSEVLLTSATS